MPPLEQQVVGEQDLPLYPPAQILLFGINNSCSMSQIPRMLLDRSASAQSLEFQIVKLFEAGRPGAVSAEKIPMLYQTYRLMHATFLTLDKALSGEPISPLLPMDVDFITPTWNVLGAGLFPEYGRPERTDVVVCIVSLGTEVVSCCTLTIMQHGIEIWGVSSNPSFKRSGSVNYLFYNIFSKMMDLYGGTLPIIRVEVPRESYPYINFYDRFWMYAKLGFTLINGSISLHMGDGTPNGVVTAQDVKIVSPLYIEGADDVQLYGSNGQVISLADSKRINPIGMPGPDRIIMSTLPNPMIARKLTEGLEQVREKGFELQPLSNDLPAYQYGFMSHSGYSLTDDRSGIAGGKLPDNVELVILNSPGSATYSNMIKHNWQFNESHLMRFPIGYLKLACPGFKLRDGKISSQDFLIATGDSPVIYLTYPPIEGNPRPGESLCQIHSYGPGDMFPELVLECNVGPRSTDWMAMWLGMYQLPASWKNRVDLSLPNVNGYVDGSSPHIQRLTELGYPDPAKKQLPSDVPPMTPSGVVTYRKLLSSLISDVPPGSPRVRLCIFSCGVVVGGGDQVNQQLRALSSLKMTRHVTLPVENYLPFLHRWGAAIDAAFGGMFLPRNGWLEAQRARGRRRSKTRKTRKRKAKQRKNKRTIKRS
jgi:hypothetical protein